MFPASHRRGNDSPLYPQGFGNLCCYYAKSCNPGGFKHATAASAAFKAECVHVRLYGALKGREAAPGPVDWTEAHAARFKEAMDDDFNTPQAVGVLFDLALEVNRTGSPELVRQLRGLGAVLNVLQLDPEAFLKGGVSEGDEARIEALIAERAAAKKARNFARADEIRDQLKNESIELLDGPQGTTWRRIG